MEDYRIFYKDKRALFTIREVVESTLVTGFLLWLEREGYSAYSLVKTIIKVLQKKANNMVSDGICRSHDQWEACLGRMNEEMKHMKKQMTTPSGASSSQDPSQSEDDS
ncbi:hypothetical protein Hanom_Chr09g00798121 [Helianthus anomalus]